jgi:hypothetical protein
MQAVENEPFFKSTHQAKQTVMPGNFVDPVGSEARKPVVLAPWIDSRALQMCQSSLTGESPYQ